MREISGTYRILVVNPEGKRPLEAYWLWEYNTKMDLQEEDMD